MVRMLKVLQGLDECINLVLGGSTYQTYNVLDLLSNHTDSMVAVVKVGRYLVNAL